MGFKKKIKNKIKNKVFDELNKRGLKVVPIDEDKDNPFALERLFFLPQVEFSETDYRDRDTDRITVSWVIPPLGIGSGGHINIFRTIHHIHNMGIHNRIFIFGGDPNTPSDILKKFVKEYYSFDLEDDEIYANIDAMKYTDAVIATSWETAYVVNNFDNAISKFYFIQDFEPYFFEMGSEYVLAEDTYKFGFRGITAGDWLAKKCRDEYGMETRSFGFSYDSTYYHLRKRDDDKKRVFYYARPYTKRRAFEIGMMTLKNLKEMMPEVEIVTAGQDLRDFNIPFEYKNLGILSFEEVAKVYSNCDLCLVLSMTNLSLLPFEVMASGSVVVSNRGDNNAWLLNEDNSVLVDNNPMEIAKTMAYYLTHEEELKDKREKGLECVKHFDWKQENRKVYEFITESVKKDFAEHDRNN